MMCCIIGFAASSEAQSLYFEDFTNESPSNANDLCDGGTAYTPPDANWTLGAACSLPGAGTPKIKEVGTTTYFEVKNEYPADSKVWTSADIDVSGVSRVLISFDTRSKGSLDASGAYRDRLKICAIKDGVEQTPCYNKFGHVDGGTSSPATDSFSVNYDVSGTDVLAFTMRVKLTGSDERYQLSNISICADENQNEICDCDETLELSAELTDQTVECLSELPTSCDESITASRGELSCILLEERLASTAYTTSTPDDGISNNDDWMIILFGSMMNDADDRRFIPTGSGVSFTTYENGTAMISGQLVDVDDPTAILNVQTIFDNEESGADWDGGFKAANACMINPMGDATTAEWSIYLMNSGLSYLTGEGSLEGTYVQLSHMPGIPDVGSPNFGFQVGSAANNVNCEFGAGGWFYYNGVFDGETMTNATGDFAMDLSGSAQTLDPCGEGESTVTLVYTAQDLGCGDVLSVQQEWTRDDTTDPTFDNAPANITINCEDELPAVPTVTASDNCTDSEGPTVEFVSAAAEGDRTDGDCPNNYTITRQWTATDCSGNVAAHTQVITVQDVTDPVITGGENKTVECDGAGNTTELMAFIADMGGASATDNCTEASIISWTNDYDAANFEAACGATGEVDIKFTATDECLNSSSVTLTFTIEDTTDPTWDEYTIYAYEACENVLDPTDPTQAPISASDDCGDVTYSITAYQMSGGCPGTWMRIWTATDACGNVSEEAEQYLELYDNVAPIPSITCPVDYSVDADAMCMAATDTSVAGVATATFTDNCDDDVLLEISYTDAEPTDLCDGSGSFSFIRTWKVTATDHCDNVGTATCGQTITVNDVTAPTITAPAMDETVECDGMGNSPAFLDWLATQGDATAFDACSDVTWTNDYYTYQPADTDFGNTYGPDSWTLVTTGNQSSVTINDDGTELVIEGPLDEQFGPGGGVGFAKACQPARARLSVTFDWYYDLSTSWPNTGSFADPAFYINDDVIHLSATTLWGNQNQSGTKTIVVEQGDEFGWGVESYVIGGLGNAVLTISNFTTEVLPSQDPCQDEQRIVTFTASDDCGNTSNTTASFFIQDTQSPVITAASAVDVACEDWSCDAMALETLGLVSASDVCGSATITVSCEDGSGGCVTPMDNYMVTYTATDDCGNSSEFLQIVNLYDSIAPVVTIDYCPAAYTAQLDAECNEDISTSAAGMASASATDNCDDNVTVDVTYEDSDPTPTCGAGYTITRTWTAIATDHCDNADTTTCTQAITVKDEIDPVITCPADMLVECDGAGNTSDLESFLAGASATDNCDADVDITTDYEDGDLSDDCGATGSVSVTFTATDDCGNTSTCTATFTIEDTTAPSIDTPAGDDTVECDGSGNTTEFQNWLNTQGGAMATDDCGDVSWLNNYECATEAGDFFTFNQGANGTTGFGDATSSDASDYLDNNFATVFPDGVTTGCASGYELVFTSADAVDTYLPCTGSAQDLVLTHGGADPNSSSDPSCWDNALVTHLLVAKLNVAFDAADANYSSSDILLSELTRSAGPLAGYTVAEIIALGDEVLGDCSDEFTPNQMRKALRDLNQNFENGVDLARFYVPGCEASVSLSDDCGATGDVTVTFTAVDECGNMATTEATFTIEDQTAPDFTGSDSEYSIACDEYDATTNYGLTVTEDCSDATITILSSNQQSDQSACAGFIYRIYEAEDACGNKSTFAQEITLTDEVDPTVEISCPSDYHVYANATCDNDLSTTAAGQAWFSADDNCDDDLDEDLSYEDADTTFTCDNSFSFTRTWTIKVTDHCGNEASDSCEQIISITDNTAPAVPSLTCPEDATVYLDADCVADTDSSNTGAPMATSTDNCDSDPALNFTYVDGDATYSCDQSEQCFMGLYSEDFEDETPENADNLCHEGSAYEPADGNWSLGPACMITTNGIPQLIEDAGDTHLLFNNKYSAGDEVFNSAEIDITGLSTVRIAFDARSQGDVENSEPYLDQFEMFIVVDGTETSLYQADGHVDGTDGGGDEEAVVLYSYENNVAVSGSTLSLRLKVKISGAGQQEQYGIDNLSVCTVDETAQGSYSFTRTWTATATDDCGNTSGSTTCDQLITVLDEISPSLSCPENTTVQCDGAGNAADLAAFLAGATATDNCDSEVELTNDYVDGSISDLCGATGAVTVIFTAKDDCGNTSTCSRTFTIEDTTDPTIDTEAGDQTVQCGEGNDAAFQTWLANHGNAAASDLCGNVSWSNNSAGLSDDCGATGSETVTFTATDECGNTATTMATFTIEDTTPPSIDTPAGNETVECGAGNAVAFQAWLNANGNAVASDLCGTVSWSNNSTGLSDGCGATGFETVTFTAKDECNNTATTTATFTIEDTTPPSLTIEGPESIDLYADANCFADTTVATLGTVQYTADDNCGNATVVVTNVDSEVSYTCTGDDATVEGSYSFTRTFTAVATDECWLSTTKTYVQTITVTDNMAPQFTSTGGIDNGATESVCCESHLGEVTIPEAVTTAYQDNCDSEVALTYTETYQGAYAPTEEVELFCLSSTPAAFENGETCSGYDPHSLRVFALPGGAEFYTAASPGLVANNADGTLTITQSVQAADGTTAGWDLEVTYGVALDWADWSSQSFPTGYKRDCGELIDDHINWEYRLIESGTLTGTGDYSGSSLSLTHAPSNNYYAGQFGLGANNMNDEYGYSGWFVYSGQFNESEIAGSGDLFGDLDCCLPWSIDRNYSIVDDCENGNQFSYSISVNGAECTDSDGPTVTGNTAGDHGPAVLGGAGDVTTGKTPIRVTNLQPNPTNDWSLLGFTVTENMRIRVDMVAMDGTLVAELYDGVASPNVNHTLDIEADNLDAGMYQVRLSSNSYLVVKKLLVSQ
ncbi:MAG: T9SS type A sorting domain-containing protein [Flavobacteriales bacterium]|nr:T9SS type A sorting domain-containing protein [Flavobacteriales bacterium]